MYKKITTSVTAPIVNDKRYNFRRSCQAAGLGGGARLAELLAHELPQTGGGHGEVARPARELRHRRHPAGWAGRATGPRPRGRIVPGLQKKKTHPVGARGETREETVVWGKGGLGKAQLLLDQKKNFRRRQTSCEAKTTREAGRRRGVENVRQLHCDGHGLKGRGELCQKTKFGLLFLMSILAYYIWGKKLLKTLNLKTSNCPASFLFSLK